jgi:hypothetical protein
MHGRPHVAELADQVVGLVSANKGLDQIRMSQGPKI